MILFLILHIYFVSFLDKPAQETPALSARAIEQRAKWQIATDALDYPVNTSYPDSLRQMGVKVHHTSRWFNGATCEMDEATATQVSQLGFVTEVEMTRDDNSRPYWISKRKRALSDGSRFSRSTGDFSWTDEQLGLYNLQPLHQAGFQGQGILMAICDGGFTNANTLSCFRQEQELGHFDFTDDEDDFYGPTGDHGTKCLSTISGSLYSFQGAATKAEYYLMRSEEYVTESPKEMDNLVAAFEAADSLGVNIFSVSLGYALFDNDDWSLPPSALDGKSTRVSLAATIAARKGMLVCVAAGNDGDNEWRTISVPADADSILTVGAVAADSTAGRFSSYGPSANGRVKPEVCGMGVQTTLVGPSGSIVTSNGTSFATPLIAGMAACLWSALPDENAMQIRERIIRSAHLYPSHDAVYQLGYGIPDAWLAYNSGGQALPKTEGATTPHKVLRNGQIYLIYRGSVYTPQGTRIE